MRFINTISSRATVKAGLLTLLYIQCTRHKTWDGMITKNTTETINPSNGLEVIFQPKCDSCFSFHLYYHLSLKRHPSNVQVEIVFVI